MRSFLDLCYILRQYSHDDDDLDKIDDLLAEYEGHREFFYTAGVRPTGFCLPRQHSLVHYRYLIEEFGSPNGLCSSITESRHITAMKEPYRRSSRFNALGQIVITNQRIDKLRAARSHFTARGMLRGTALSEVMGLVPEVEDTGGAEEAGSGDEDGEVESEVVAVDGFDAQTRVELARRPGELIAIIFIHYLAHYLP